MIKLRGADVAWQEVDDEIICLDLANSRYLSVNEAGAALWPLLVAGTTLEQLIDHLATTFDLSAEQAATDTNTFVAELERRSLLDAG